MVLNLHLLTLVWSAPGRSDEDDEVADELGEEEDKDLEVHGLRGTII